jgi:hypothetical protein
MPASRLEPGDVDEESQDLLAAGQKLLPTAAEMEGMLGVGASVLRMTDDGLVLVQEKVSGTFFISCWTSVFRRS